MPHRSGLPRSKYPGASKKNKIKNLPEVIDSDRRPVRKPSKRDTTRKNQY